MGRIGNFLLGFLIGGATVYASLHYHVVRADDGMHMVPKLTSTFAETYVDVRGFGFDEWNQHRTLALALAQSDKGYLVEGIAVDALDQSMRDLLGQ